MNISYRRDLNHNYLIVETEWIQGTEYSIQMLQKNSIDGLLPISVRQINGDILLYYEITSRQSLSQVYEREELRSQDILRLLDELEKTVLTIRQFLLDGQDILLHPDYIYTDPSMKSYQFCCVPGSGALGTYTMEDLAEFLLKRLDHDDAKAVSLGYQFYKLAEGGKLGIQQIRQQMEISEGTVRQNRQTSPAYFDTQEHSDKQYKYRDADRTYSYDREEQGESDFREKKHSKRNSKENNRKENKSRENKRKENQRENNRKGSSVREKNRKKTVRLLLCLLGISMILLLFLLIVWFAGLDLTQTGGLAFLFLAVSWLSISWFWGKKKKDNRWDDLEDEEEETEYEDVLTEEDDEAAFLEALQSEAYRMPYQDSYSQTDRVHPFEIRQESYLRSGFDRKRELPVKPEQQSEEGATRCLAENLQMKPLTLISLEPEQYRDLITGKNAVLIGKRKDQVDLWIKNDNVSRVHAKIERTENEIRLTDMNSMNGTFVNGRRLEPNESIFIASGDQVSFAGCHYKIR